MQKAVISATGLFTPEQSISNEELVGAYNAWAEGWNAANAEAIAAGEIEAKTPSSEAFIEKASGIKARYVMDKSGVLDPERMLPHLAARGDDELSILAEMAVKAAEDAIRAWGKPVSEIGDSHFIFGDVATAVIIEAEDQAGPGGWDILGTKLQTSFSNNIRNNFGFLNRAALPTDGHEPVSSDGLTDKMFVQQGRKVFKEVVPMVSEMILDHAAELDLDTHGLKRLWLHQANINMNTLIGKKVLGREPEPSENVIILDDYANTSSAGSIIAFHLHNDGFAPGETGLICSFGAGYSAGTVFVQKRP
ncbi:MAG: beta-ketoacyl-ACP synthase III [Brevundimonas diminuta]|nr:3-oxoacyl-[acyl-carrier-protein] synthase III C-terminal domain-containing protein [Brevundimonas diminuta]MBD3819762.1 beta-ketoacyl-ACP synthase III [Brevundimonas diminuta]